MSVRRTAVLISVATALALTACSAHGTPVATPVISVAPSPVPAPTAAASAGPKQYFADEKAYQAWIIDVQAGATLTLDIAHHLVNSVTSSPATKYLTDHSASPGADGVPNDYIDVDTHVHKTQKLSATAKITVNPDAAGPEAMTVAKFLDWLKINEASPLPAKSPEVYFGQPRYVGPLFQVKFKKDVVVSVSQIFEP